MKTESLREVKNNLSRVIESLDRTGAVLITRNGRSSAVLLPLTEDTDIEALALAISPKFWRLFDAAAASPTWTPLAAATPTPSKEPIPRARRAPRPRP